MNIELVLPYTVGTTHFAAALLVPQRFTIGIIFEALHVLSLAMVLVPAPIHRCSLRMLWVGGIGIQNFSVDDKSSNGPPEHPLLNLEARGRHRSHR